MNYELKITDRRDIYRSYELQVTSYSDTDIDADI